MITIKGTYNHCKIFARTADDHTAGQLRSLLDQPWTAGLKIRVMPDCHVGKGCVIGTTMTINGVVAPNHVGVDIGCGVLAVGLGRQHLDHRLFARLDDYIRRQIPHGFATHRQPVRHQPADLSQLKAAGAVDLNRAGLSIGSLGGGNHFIELDTDRAGNVYLLIHSGSRHLGKQICEHYQRLAVSCLKKKQGGKLPDAAADSAGLSGQLLDHYLHDMKIVQKYADINRRTMAGMIIQNVFSLSGLDNLPVINSVHNYIDLGQMILRKGAISAQRGEMVVIPLNMAEGALICRGKGNPDWNYSAPHGAGRLYSRQQAKKQLSLAKFRQAMQGVYTTTATAATLDECPDAYKPAEEIIAAIGDTVEVLEHIKPVYNFKAG